MHCSRQCQPLRGISFATLPPKIVMPFAIPKWDIVHGYAIFPNSPRKTPLFLFTTPCHMSERRKKHLPNLGKAHTHTQHTTHTHTQHTTHNTHTHNSCLFRRPLGSCPKPSGLTSDWRPTDCGVYFHAGSWVEIQNMFLYYFRVVLSVFHTL